MWYRYFLGPPSGPERKPSISVSLLAGPTAGTLDQYAQSYLAGHTVTSSPDASRQGVSGRSWRFGSADGSRRFALLLLQHQGHVWGLYAQADAAAFDQHRTVVDEMEKSLTLERPSDYVEHREDRYGVSLHVPSSWRVNQTFATGGTYLQQFISPALAANQRQTVHASLTVTVEPAPGDGALDAFRKAVLDRLGEAYKPLTHTAWRGGHVDMMRAETPLAMSRIKRYFWTSGGRGYSLSCEAREDAFHRVTRWCDVIASTLQIGGRPLPAEAPAPAAAPAASPSPPRALIAR